MRSIAQIFAVLLALSAFAAPKDSPAGEIVIPPPGERDTCPVCGMFVVKYPQWLAAVVYKDGHAHYFDGAKDLFKYLLAYPKYAPGHNKDDIARVAVTEYYDLLRLDAHTAIYVIGSDVTGPMGHELVPLASREDAEEFIRDHKGRMVPVGGISLELLARLDRGQLD